MRPLSGAPDAATARAAHAEPRLRDSYPFPSHGGPSPCTVYGGDHTEPGRTATAEAAVALVVRHLPPKPGQRP
ncbi:hypothetical protein ACIPX0_33560 [Streptomyces sp. NPDC090075]|uniref:hypothetical protein n=1 Tax=unclassified Streptomyces TaxID=2593676 RepID=UPI0033F3B3B5